MAVHRKRSSTHKSAHKPRTAKKKRGGAKFIQKAIKRPGALRQALGKKEGETISASELSGARARAKRTGNTRLLRQVNLAITLKKLRRRK